MIGIQTDEDELLIDGTIKCESEEDYYMILDELYRDRREEIENENVDWCSYRSKRKNPLCRCYMVRGTVSEKSEWILEEFKKLPLYLQEKMLKDLGILKKNADTANIDNI